ncbi:MAG: fused MFS/spermidine synthase [Gammaproteobacteria bacterium]|nr:fused MFS/spermidine synthase [Gammaproteobacteria bacterium]
MTRARCIYREEHDDTHLEIWDEGDLRSLWFDDTILQTEIHLHDPAVLPNPVNRAMLAHLMFEVPFHRVLLAGCGGGAIARWLHARAPDVAGDAIELSHTVARLAREYFDFPPERLSNWHLMVEDVREHLVHSTQRYDFILVDLEENQATPDWLTGREFLTGCREHLNEQGTLTLNLIVDASDAASEALLRIRQVFDGETLLLSNPDHDNLLVLAFNGGTPAIPGDNRLRDLGRRWGIDFTSMAKRMTRLAAPLATS